MTKILTAYKNLEEVPENEKDFFVEEDGKILYVNDGLINTLKSQREAEKKAKLEKELLEKRLKELEEMKNNTKEENKTEEQKTQENEVIKELEKRIEELAEHNRKEAERNKQLLLNNKKLEAMKQAGIKTKFGKLYDDRIKQDENGVFVCDENGNTIIDPLTGGRIDLVTFFKNEAKNEPAILEKSASGAGVAGSGLQGTLNTVKLSQEKQNELRDQYANACRSGDMRLMNKLEMQAIKSGLKL